MYDVVITGGILAVPSSDSDPSAFEHYLHRILCWGRLAKEPWIAFLWSERTIEHLLSVGRYPLTVDLVALFSTCSIDYASIVDVRRITSNFLSRTPTLEEYFQDRDAIWRDFECYPDLVGVTECPTVRSDLERILALIGVHISCHPEKAQFPITLLPECPKGVSSLAVKLVIEALEHTDGNSAFEEITIAVHAPVATNPSTFALLVNAIEVWTASHGGSGAEAAVKIRCLQDAARDGVRLTWEEVPAFRLGPSFWDSVVQLQFDHDKPKVDKLLNAIASRLFERHHHAAHALREGAGAMEPQILRGKDKAMRLDVDYEYHVHYWETSTGPEFAAVRTHNDFSIPR